MTMQTKTTDLKVLADAFGKDENWASAILGKLGVLPDETGSFDKRKAAHAVEYLLFHSSPAAPSGNVSASDRSCRERLEDRFEQHGLEVVGHALKKGTRVTLRRPDGTEVYVLVYVTLGKTTSGQASFTVNHLHVENYKWFAFVAEPFNKVYLRRREEILSRLRNRKLREEVRTANVTFSSGSDVDLFDNRIQELVEGREE